jgi:hypothetical protein
MKENSKVIIAVFTAIMIIGIYGCTGIQKRFLRGKEKEDREEQAIPMEEEKIITTQEAFDTADIRSLLRPVISLSFFNLSLDYYEQFVWDEDALFPDYIYYALESSSDGYDEGVGTILVEKNGRGEIEYVLERALLRVNDDGSKWWQVHQTTKYTTLFYEALVSPEGIPLKIRTIHPKTGEHAEAVPRIGVQYTEDKKKLLMRLEKKKDAEINQEWEFLFNEPRIIGEEMVKVESGVKKSIHISDQLPDEELNIDYWVSTEVPGGFVKAVYTTALSETELTLELIQIKGGYKPQFGPLD